MRGSVITCHILEWELYEFFRKQKGKHPISQNEILSHLPFRARYHNKRSGRDAISEPYEAYPLISIQAIVFFLDTRRDDGPTWRAVLAKRSQNVIVKPGFFQFQPAGGFEVFGSEDDDTDFLVRLGFNIGDALLREYAEELFNVKDFQINREGRDPYSIRSHPVVDQLITAVSKKTAWIEFIGTIVDLTLLRHEFSFVIIIKDDFFCKSQILGSWEAKNIASPRVEELRTILSSGPLHGSCRALIIT